MFINNGETIIWLHIKRTFQDDLNILLFYKMVILEGFHLTFLFFFNS